MREKIIEYIYPLSGGIIGANIGFLPNIKSIISVIILSIIGAISGYFMKKLLDFLFKRRKK